MAKKIDDLFGASRWVLPEQKAAILEHNAVRGLVERPSIDEDEFGEMCFRIYDSTQYDYAINVKWFVPSKGCLGTFEEAWGVVREIDATRKRFKLVNDWDSRWINVEDIVSVTK
ncbi:YolD-like family protein [Brevibacillus choshinensis]|uniref:YolD-like family protein n=1 Tax=Brevibacillus choshinensis TaxID=54911 RepID=UPI002E1F14B6|nr:YolD-like family protein [Brevibacillus choshinensis]